MSLARLLPVAALAAIALLIAALAYHDANPADYWSPAIQGDTLIHVVIGALLATALRYWRSEHAVAVLTGVAGVYVAGGLGILQSASALLLAAACVVLGRRTLAFMFPSQASSITAAFICGLALYLAVFGLMIHLPVNYRAIYFMLMCAPLVAEWRAGHLPLVYAGFSGMLANAGNIVRALPYAITVTALIGVVLLARLAFLPTMTFDDNALHLGMWSQLRHEHIYAFDYVAQIWEVAPFVVDLLHASVSLVAGADARGATNVLLLAILLRQLWVVLGALQLDAGKRWLLLVLFASTPLTGYLLISMQTELFMALLAVAGVRLMLELRGGWCSPHSAALLAIAAMCCGAKLPGAVLGLALLTAAISCLWVTRGLAHTPTTRSVVLFGVFTTLLATVAFNSYVTAWVLTGNPVFPLYNGIFKSPYFDAYNFVDDRWIKGFSLGAYADLFFNTSGYYESRNFVAGFQYLVLLPLGLVCLLSARTLRQYAVPLLVPLLGFGVIMFASTQYWRYQFPVFPLATVVVAALLVPQYSRRGLQAVVASILVCILLNFAFYPGISGFLEIAPSQSYTAHAKQDLLDQHVPARALTAWVNDNAPGSRVLYPEAVPFGATLHGTPIYVNWYSPENSAHYYEIRDEADGMAFLQNRQINYVIAWIYDPGLPGTMAWALRRFLSRVGVPVLQVGDHILYRIDGADVPYVPIFSFNEEVTVDNTPRMLGSVTTGAATAMRYQAGFACADNAGYFAAQINWNNGQYYYHQVQCSSDWLEFVEGSPIPVGATSGDIYVSVGGTPAATLTQLSIEILE